MCVRTCTHTCVWIKHTWPYITQGFIFAATKSTCHITATCTCTSNMYLCLWVLCALTWSACSQTPSPFLCFAHSCYPYCCGCGHGYCTSPGLTCYLLQLVTRNGSDFVKDCLVLMNCGGWRKRKHKVDQAYNTFTYVLCPERARSFIELAMDFETQYTEKV